MVHLRAEDPDAHAVERADQWRWRTDVGARKKVCRAFAHLLRRFIRESYGKDGGWRHVLVGDKVGDAIGERARFARSRAGDDKRRSFGCAHGFLLCLVQFGKEKCHTHGSMCWNISDTFYIKRKTGLKSICVMREQARNA